MKIYRPTTKSRRHITGYDFSSLSVVAPWKKLTSGFLRARGRNNQGRITIRHKGGGAKRRYRLIDFKQNDKYDIPAKVEALEYDPNRTARIARVLYSDGERRYIIAPEELKVGDRITTHSAKGALQAGSRLKLRYIPQGTLIYNIELQPGRGGQIVRSAGSAAQILASEDERSIQVKLPSGEVRRLPQEAMASIGRVSNSEHMHITYGKAGRSRWLGIRPTVRGSAMSPVDHPHGGGENRQGIGLKYPKTPWGKIAIGGKTRKRKKYSNKFIVKRRK